MAIFATRRKCEVTRRWAASESSCSRQRLASMYSSCGWSMGNLRISSRYRDSPPSAAIIGSAEAILFLLLAPLVSRPNCDRKCQPQAEQYHRPDFGRKRAGETTLIEHLGDQAAVCEAQPADDSHANAGDAPGLPSGTLSQT